MSGSGSPVAAPSPEIYRGETTSSPLSPPILSKNNTSPAKETEPILNLQKIQNLFVLRKDSGLSSIISPPESHAKRMGMESTPEATPKKDFDAFGDLRVKRVMSKKEEEAHKKKMNDTSALISERMASTFGSLVQKANKTAA